MSKYVVMKIIVSQSFIVKVYAMQTDFMPHEPYLFYFQISKHLFNLRLIESMDVGIDRGIPLLVATLKLFVKPCMSALYRGAM